MDPLKLTSGKQEEHQGIRSRTVQQLKHSETARFFFMKFVIILISRNCYFAGTYRRVGDRCKARGELGSVGDLGL